MSSPRNKQQQPEQQTGSSKRIDSSGGRQRLQQDAENCFNSLSDAEEHFEFSPDIADDPQAGEELGLNESKLSSDSFRSTSSASSLSNSNNNPFPRNTHLRQSFSSRNTSWSPRTHFNRRSLTSHNNCNSNQFKSISANGHARQMFSSNGNSPSSRRSSLSDEAISNTDPTSLYEDDVLDLTQKIASLEQQVSALNQSQQSNDDRYSRVKQENSTLLSKVHLLEEQLRDIEIQSEERRKAEEKRNRESMARLEREKSFENDNYVNRIFSLQQELYDAKDNARKYQLGVEKMKEDRDRLQDMINSKEEEMERLQQELDRAKEAVRRFREEETARERLCNVLQAELNDLKQVRNHQMLGCTKEDHSMSESKLNELELTLTSLRIDNKNLREANEELQAQLLNSRLEEGRCLVRNGERVTTSLADELVTLNEEQLRKGLMEQQEVNAELRRYIDGVLMNIIENYPQLLEVKQIESKPK